MDMNIQKCRALIKTAEYGSFTKAAEALSYSQSGISRMISDLENEWKVTLLERGRSGARLTSEGIILLPYVKSVCEEYQKLATQVDELNVSSVPLTAGSNACRPGCVISCSGRITTLL